MHWTKDEVDFLQDCWGIRSMKYIAERLGRSVGAVQQKAQKIGLGDARFCYEGITICQLMQALNKSYNSVNAWIERYGMPVRRKVFSRTERVKVISYEAFWKWAEQHKELINLAKMEPGMLGPEPEWAKVKRKADQLRSQKTWQSKPWTPGDDQRLLQMVRLGSTYPELATHFNRSESSIKRRLYDLNSPYRPKRTPPYSYTSEEVQKLVRMAEQGHAYETIAKELGKSALGVRGKLEQMGFDFKRRRLLEVAK